MSKVADLAYMEIRQRIIDGVYGAGAHLTEELLARDVGASRTPVREALRRLNAEQLVEFAPNRGAFVASWSDEDIIEIYILRAALEGRAAFRATTRITAEQIDELERQIAVIDTCIPTLNANDRLRFVEANQTFHTIILNAAHSERLTKILSWLVSIPVMMRTVEKYVASDLQRSNNHHRDLLAAIRAGDPEWAQQVMASHLYAAERLHRRSQRSDANIPAEPP